MMVRRDAVYESNVTHLYPWMMVRRDAVYDM